MVGQNRQSNRQTSVKSLCSVQLSSSDVNNPSSTNKLKLKPKRTYPEGHRNGTFRSDVGRRRSAPVQEDGRIERIRPQTEPPQFRSTGWEIPSFVTVFVLAHHNVDTANPGSPISSVTCSLPELPTVNLRKFNVKRLAKALNSCQNRFNPIPAADISS
jgi:hypothetical protein